MTNAEAGLSRDSTEEKPWRPIGGRGGGKVRDASGALPSIGNLAFAIANAFAEDPWSQESRLNGADARALAEALRSETVHTKGRVGDREGQE